LAVQSLLSAAERLQKQVCKEKTYCMGVPGNQDCARNHLQMAEEFFHHSSWSLIAKDSSAIICHFVVTKLS